MWHYLIGYVIGFIIGRIAFKRHHMNGNFQVNESNPNKDVFTLYIDNFDMVHTKKYLLLKITRK